MDRFEYRVFRLNVGWDGGDYNLEAMIQKDEWRNANSLGDEGWEFVAFVPNPDVYIKDTFPEEERRAFVRLGVFKRRLA